MDPNGQRSSGSKCRRMIEVIHDERCIDCDRCVDVCPTNVFDADKDDHPVIARQSDCQTCFLCEA